MGSKKITITPEQINSARIMAGMGFTIPMIAACLDFSEITFYRLIKRDKELSQAMESGKQQGAGKVIKTAYDMAVSGKSPRMTAFWLKTQQGWRETTRLELTGPNGEALAIGQLPPDKRQKRIQHLLDIKAKLDDYNSKSGLPVKQPEVMPAEEKNPEEESEKLPGE